VTLRSAHLLGRDHHTIGAVAAVAEGPVAITLSRGGAPKRYTYVEPNEDATLFAHGVGGTLVAVADGHDGAGGAQTVIAYLESEWAPRWTGERDRPHDEASWRIEAERALAGANHAVLADAGRRGLPPAPTTLALAVVRRHEGAILWAGIGDSHVFTVEKTAACDVLKAALADQRRAFLGYEAMTDEILEARAAAGRLPSSETCALVLATDGLSETGIGVDDPERTVHALARDCIDVDPELRPLELARRVSGAALESHRRHDAGDNIASAAVWIEG